MSGDHNMNQAPGWRKRQIALDKKAENARELGLDYEPVYTHELVEAYIQAAVQAEREACAKVCDEQWKDAIACGDKAGALRCIGIRTLIRARGQA